MPGPKRFPEPGSSAVEKLVTTAEKSENNKSGLDFFHIFPEEIWIMILSKVDADLKKVILNSNLRHLRHLLLPIRQNFLFPEVWDVLCNKYQKKGSYLFKETQLSKGSSALRKVCRGWRDGVDQACCKRVLTFQSALDKNDYFDIPEGFWNNREFNNAEKITRFVEYFDSTETGANPFASGGHVHFTSPLQYEDVSNTVRYERSRQYHSAVKDLLSKYGQNVTLCKISVTDAFTSRLEYFSSINEWFNFMPNLVGLEWKYRGGDVYPQDYLEDNPIPAWEQLQIAKFVSIPVPVVDHVLIKNNKIQMLTTTPNMFSLKNVAVPELQRLCIGIITPRELLKLEKCEHDWELQAILLDFKYSEGLSWNRIFTVLQKWVGTLTEVTIRIKLAEMWEAQTHHQEKARLERKYRKLPNQRLQRMKLQVYDFA